MAFQTGCAYLGFALPFCITVKGNEVSQAMKECGIEA